MDPWEVINDIIDSFELAMREEGLDGLIIQGIVTTVRDYAANHYGDD